MFRNILQPSLRATRTMATASGGNKHKAVIDDVLKLYQLKPTEEVYSRYAPNAVFHDPVSIATGLDAIKSQFNGMSKIFESSTTQKVDELPTTPNGDSIMLDLTQHYVFKGKMTPEKTVNSKITIKLNKDGKIEHHEEEWDHKSNSTGEDGFLGKLQEYRKKFNSKVIQSAVSSDTSKA